MTGEGMYFVPCMQKTVLSKVVGQVMITTKLSQEVSDLGLMASHQFTKRDGVLLRHHSRDKIDVITAVHTRRIRAYPATSFDPYRHMIK